MSTVLLVSAPPVTAERPGLVADRDWPARANLQRIAVFPFITRFLGPGATLTRYTPEGGSGVVIDVLTAPNLARLNDYDDAVWYPSSTPVTFVAADLGASVPAKAAHSDPDSATADLAEQWYALTWLWQTSDDFQRVTVLVSQDLDSGVLPPAPQPITWSNALLGPMLWLTRQQPAPTGVVSKRVSRAAAETARYVLRAGGSR
jgi:hypothetical protein